MAEKALSKEFLVTKFFNQKFIWVYNFKESSGSLEFEVTQPATTEERQRFSNFYSHVHFWKAKYDISNWKYSFFLGLFFNSAKQ